MAALDAFRSDGLGASVDLDDLSEEDLDYAIAEYIIDLYECSDGVDGIGAAGTLLACLARIRPRLRLKTAWRCLDVWRTRCPPKQAPTVPLELAFAAVSYLTMAGKAGLGCAVLLCFAGLLRASEALRLTWADVHFVGSRVVIVLGQTKRGMEEKVILTNSSVVAWMRGFREATYSGKDYDRVCPGMYNTLTRWFRAAAAYLGFGAISWTTHGLRRGGATELLQRHVSLHDIMIMGRWRTERSCREYLRRGEVALLRLRQDLPRSAWERCHQLAAWGPAIWRMHVDID